MKNSCLFLNINSSVLEENIVGSKWIYKVCSSFGIETSRVIIEFSENKFANIRAALEIMESLKNDGFKIAIDDFGSAYSNLKRLVSIDPDFIKIDRDLINSISQDSKRQLIVETICGLSYKLNILCIAEGVEDINDVTFCYKAGINLFQGYFFAIPLMNPSIEETKGKIQSLKKKLERPCAQLSNANGRVGSIISKTFRVEERNFHISKNKGL